MKILTLILGFVTIVNGACESGKKPTAEAAKIESVAGLKSIAWSAYTRGKQELISVTETNLVVSENGTVIKEKKITTEDWKLLSNVVKNIPLNEIANLEAPSQKRFVDADLASKIEINTNSASFTSSEFDKTQPPKTLAPLINKIKSLAGN
jgi:hypothetical protein